jgi:hypothetical protein
MPFLTAYGSPNLHGVQRPWRARIIPQGKDNLKARIMLAFHNARVSCKRLSETRPAQLTTVPNVDKTFPVRFTL